MHGQGYGRVLRARVEVNELRGADPPAHPQSGGMRGIPQIIQGTQAPGDPARTTTGYETHSHIGASSEPWLWKIL
jgi:hypothetical protein